MKADSSPPAGNPLGTAPVGRLLLQFAVPSIISTLVAALYNMVDQIFIGQRIGYLGNAATTVAFPLTYINGALTLLFSNGSAVNFNLFSGRGNKEEALSYAGNGLTLLGVEGVSLGLLVGLFTSWFVAVFGSTADVFPYAVTYIRIIAVGLPFLALTSGGTLLVRSDGSPRYAMWCSLSGVLLNFVLDWLFLFPLNLGIAGAAWATVLGQILSALLLVRYLFRFRTGRLERRHFRVTAKRAKAIAAIGAAASFNQAAMVVMNTVRNNQTPLNAQQYKALQDEIGLVKLPANLVDRTDWQDEVYRTGLTQDYQLSVTNGNEKLRYYLSGGYTGENGVLKKSDFSRYNVRATIDNDISKWLTVSASVAYSDYTFKGTGIISGTGSNRGGVITSIISMTMEFPDADPMTETRRIRSGGENDFYRLEKLNELSRSCCASPEKRAPG